MKSDVAPANSMLGRPPAMQPWIRRIEDWGLVPGSRILAVGADTGPLVTILRALGHDVTVAGPVDGLAAPEREFDGVIALGFLERARWDRWALRRLRHTLKPDGLLVLAVPNIFSPLSLANPVYLARKLSKQFSKMLRRAGSPRSIEPIRSYPAGALRSMVEQVGFKVRDARSLGPPGLRSWPGAGGWTASHHLVIAQRRPGLFGPGSDRPFPDPGRHRERYEHDHRGEFEARDQWRARHAVSAVVATPFEPGSCAGRSVLVLSPHPDDEIIGCGGTLSRLVEAGAQVTVLQATDGSASASLEGEPEAIRRTIRLEEARQVAETAGFRPTIFWKEDNAAFAARPELVTRLRDLLTAIRPALVFTPFLTDLHPDHQTLNRILAAAIAEPMDDALRIMGYEVWGSAVVSTYCDVARSMPLLERLLGIYDTAMMADDFVSMLWTRNYYHSLVLRGCPGFVEAFFKCDPRRFRELVLSDEGIRVHATT